VGYIARRVRRFAVTLGILLAISSVWFFADADLTNCVSTGLYDYMGPEPSDFLDYPRARPAYLGVQECWRPDLVTDLERVITGREHPALERVTSGLARAGSEWVGAIPNTVLWAALVACLSILAVDSAWRRSAK
jgi:hypothetical protein